MMKGQIWFDIKTIHHKVLNTKYINVKFVIAAVLCIIPTITNGSCL